MSTTLLANVFATSILFCSDVDGKDHALTLDGMAAVYASIGQKSDATGALRSGTSDLEEAWRSQVAGRDIEQHRHRAKQPYDWERALNYYAQTLDIERGMGGRFHEAVTLLTIAALHNTRAQRKSRRLPMDALS